MDLRGCVCVCARVRVCFVTEQTGSKQEGKLPAWGQTCLLLNIFFFSESAKVRVLTPMKLHLHL